MSEKDRLETYESDHAVNDADVEGGLTDAEMDAETGEELPERDQMSLVNLNLAMPVNAAVAANVLSDGSTAWADAAQGGTYTQGN